MPYSLGQAISTNYSVPQGNIAGAFANGLQLAQARQARQAAAALKRDAAVAKQDEAYQKALDSVDFKDLNPYVLPKVKEETAGLIAEANKLYAADPAKNYMAARKKLQEAQNKVYEGKQLSQNVDRFVETPDEKLSSAAKQLKNLLYEQNDIRALEGIQDPVTGESVVNSQLKFNVNDYADINKVRNEVFGKVLMERVGETNLGKNQREFKYEIPKEVAAQTAQELWSDPRIRDKYIDENRDYVIGKYYKGVPEEFRSKKILAQDEAVQADLYEKFLKETTTASKKFGKTVMDAIPTPPKPTPAPDTKNNVNTSVSTTTEKTTNPIFGPNRKVTTVHISTPPKGENEKTTFEANTAFIDNNGAKKTVSLKGKPVSGSVIDIKSSPNPNDPNAKEVYAVVESDVLTNKELFPEKYSAVLAKKTNKLTAEEKQLVDEANNKSKQLYYVPLRDVATNFQAELRRYNNTDIIKRIEESLGIRYEDYLPKSSSAKPKTVVQNGITYTLNEQTGQYE